MPTESPTQFRQKAVLLSPEQVHRAIKRMTHEILERNSRIEDLVILGIRTRGIPLAERIAAYLASIEGGGQVPTGSLDITFYRDDLRTVGPQPEVGETRIPVDISGKQVILVDDVLYTGRTVRSAMDEIMDYGRPASIQLVSLIDRGHRELPIRADYVGKNVPTSSRETVEVLIEEIDGRDEVLLMEVDQ
ncbi:MAG: bifunctional pyr operon transcriptional regulator/uracil phosphoribosyltransferase PyrR [Candidatus Krumholzibacteria bacterium]|jgi:pyrimidine operon attenuation protein/uracil phosphoribosyltransferase|nr:bifunctional pyr operon transcriptional regulator/uracil phosphoribosyltransferase PyrR [Candidatus Krumholzibacteria bacterium]MDP6669375.1 bifunctional pyr operon transcriptional regulator/uracil phosphoribosyltransferase PyrR [Candidatus Krumholzibacteria bacterium]MDP6797211.1 bifunctional pyr operon transcriptional regulator/uracil phosphoribosyltransferase PyrR [Candidatus Krumholzibacteria bacterium]MDP7022504.1 bifunctional pyr operon transcriptional regulator/uracil phosphoribosyltra